MKRCECPGYHCSEPGSWLVEIGHPLDVSFWACEEHKDDALRGERDVAVRYEDEQ